MKIKQIFLGVAMLSGAFSSGIAGAQQEGRGGDRVEVLFMKARDVAVGIIGKVELNSVQQLRIAQEFKNWLVGLNDSRAGSVNLAVLQFYLKYMRLAFIDGPCNEDGKPRSTSYSNADPSDPVMCVSRSLNVTTQLDEATALVIHEAAHFTGFMNHLFLSAMGAEIAKLSFDSNEVANKEAKRLVEKLKLGLYLPSEKNTERCAVRLLEKIPPAIIVKFVSPSNPEEVCPFFASKSIQQFNLNPTGHTIYRHGFDLDFHPSKPGEIEGSVIVSVTVSPNLSLGFSEVNWRVWDSHEKARKMRDSLWKALSARLVYSGP